MTDWILDPNARTARRGLQIVKLSAAQYSLLEGLIDRAGQLLTYRDVFRLTWHREPRQTEADYSVGIMEELLSLLADEQGDPGFNVARMPGLGYCIQPIALDSLGDAIRRLRTPNPSRLAVANALNP